MMYRSGIEEDTKVKMTQRFGDELQPGDILVACGSPDNHGGFWATADKNAKRYWVMLREVEVITPTV